MTPKISIIMPVYNGEKYLAEAIESVLKQTLPDFELIIINDQSTDQSKTIAEKYLEKDSRIIVSDNFFEKGLAGALNTGLKTAKGLYIVRADADDVLIPNRLKIQLDFLESHRDIDIIGGGYKTFGGINEREIFHPSSSIEIARKFLTDTYFCHPTVMFRRPVLNTVDKYPAVSCEDFAFFSEIIHKHKGYNIKKILINYREHQNNYSSSHREKIAESVHKTFEDNYLFYLGSLNGSNEYFNFKSKNTLHLGDVTQIIKTEVIILKNIRKTYDIKTISWQNIKSLFNFSKEVIIALLITSYHKIKHGNR